MIRRARFIAALLAAAIAVPAAAAPLFTPIARSKSAPEAPTRFANTQAIVIDAGTLGAMKPGDIATATLGGRTHEVVLDRLERHDDGSLTWVGHVQGESPDDLVVLTAGPLGTYGTLTVPQGRWGVIPGEAHDWLFDAEASPAVGVDRTAVTDARIPPGLAGSPRAKADPSCPVITAKPSAQATIDLLVVLTPDFVNAHGGAANANTRVNNLVATINTYYANSKIAITLRRVATITAPYPTAASQDGVNCNASPEPAACDGAALDAITAGTGPFANVANLRRLYGADMVALLRGPRGGGGASGVAWVGGYQQSAMSSSQGYMYSVNGDGPGIPATLMAHELGHNMGNHHDPANAGTTTFGATSYAYGYTRCGSNPGAPCPTAGGANGAGAGGFGTIMSYWRPTVGRFSNPNDTCSANGSGNVPCGGTVSSGSPAFTAQADEVRTINCMRTAIAAMRTPYLATCANPALDSDGDGAPNCVEQAMGLNPGAKDHDIFAANPTGNLFFAMQQYRDFLSREADPEGAHGWTDSLNVGARTRAGAIEALLGSTEFEGAIAPVTRLYFAYFRRIPDYGGLQYWIGRYRAGFSHAAISQQFAASAEFANTYGALGNAAFVSLVYNNVLGRAPDAGGLAYWTNELNTGARTRGDVMLGFSESAEYRALSASEVQVTMLYAGMLRRAPDAGGFGYWVGYLDAGNTGLALVNNFLGAAEYRARFLS